MIRFAHKLPKVKRLKSYLKLTYFPITLLPYSLEQNINSKNNNKGTKQ